MARSRPLMCVKMTGPASGSTVPVPFAPRGRNRAARKQRGSAMTKERFDIHQHITDKIVSAIERGAGDFRLPWHRTKGSIMLPVNIASKKAYRCVNVVALWAYARNSVKAPAPPASSRAQRRSSPPSMWTTIRFPSSTRRRRQSSRRSSRPRLSSPIPAHPSRMVAAGPSIVPRRTAFGFPRAEPSSAPHEHAGGIVLFHALFDPG